MKKRILIGSCGGLTGSYLARRYRLNDEFYLVGTGVDMQNGTRPFLDEFLLVPPASHPDFTETLFSILNEHNIDYYIPTHSAEIRVVSQNENAFRQKWNGAFLVCPYETIQKLDDKVAANKSLSEIGLSVPTLITSPDETVQYPIFMKPNQGSGSKKALVVENQALHLEYLKLDPQCSFYQLIKGTEYTVDCMFDAAGRLLAYNQRVRLKTMGGGAIITQNRYDIDISPWLKKLEQAFVFKGCVNFQFILSNGVPYFTDVNLRYASGGLPLTVASGIDIPQMLLDILAKRPVAAVRSCPADGLTMYRYFEEWFED